MAPRGAGCILHAALHKQKSGYAVTCRRLKVFPSGRNGSEYKDNRPRRFLNDRAPVREGEREFPALRPHNQRSDDTAVVRAALCGRSDIPFICSNGGAKSCPGCLSKIFVDASLPFTNFRLSPNNTLGI